MGSEIKWLQTNIKRRMKRRTEQFDPSDQAKWFQFYGARLQDKLDVRANSTPVAIDSLSSIYAVRGIQNFLETGNFDDLKKEDVWIAFELSFLSFKVDRLFFQQKNWNTWHGAAKICALMFYGNLAGRTDITDDANVVFDEINKSALESTSSPWREAYFAAARELREGRQVCENVEFTDLTSWQRIASTENDDLLPDIFNFFPVFVLIGSKPGDEAATGMDDLRSIVGNLSKVENPYVETIERCIRNI